MGSWPMKRKNKCIVQTVHCTLLIIFDTGEDVIEKYSEFIIFFVNFI